MRFFETRSVWAASLCVLIAAAHCVHPSPSAQAASIAEGKVPHTLRFSATKTADVKYEIELGKAANLKPVLAKGVFASSEVVIYLRPDTYYFHARTISKQGVAGPWSAVKQFTVKVPTLLQDKPVNKHAFDLDATEQGINFAWISGLVGTKYVLLIEDGTGTDFRVELNDKKFLWRPSGPGNYKWKVGFDVAGVTQFTEPRTFTVSNKRSPASIAASLAKQNELDSSQPRPQEWWVLGRGAQAIVAYSTDDKDTGIQGSGAALVALLSAELRWRQRVNPGQKWTFSGAANFEMIRQIVLDTTFSMPRFYGRVFTGREFGLFRLGGFVQLSYGESGIFVVQNQTQARKGKVTRTGYGIGPMITYRATPNLFLSFIALGRLDSGGVSDAIPTPLQSSPAIEAGFGASYNFSRSLSLEGRLRLLQESFKWAPAKGGSEHSSLTDNFIILDLGLGYKL